MAIADRAGYHDWWPEAIIDRSVWWWCRKRSLLLHCISDHWPHFLYFCIQEAMIDKGMLRHAHEFEGFVKHKHGWEHATCTDCPSVCDCFAIHSYRLSGQHAVRPILHQPLMQFFIAINRQGSPCAAPVSVRDLWCDFRFRQWGCDVRTPEIISYIEWCKSRLCAGHLVRFSF